MDVAKDMNFWLRSLHCIQQLLIPDMLGAKMRCRLVKNAHWRPMSHKDIQPLGNLVPIRLELRPLNVEGPIQEPRSLWTPIHPQTFNLCPVVLKVREPPANTVRSEERRVG